MGGIEWNEEKKNELVLYDCVSHCEWSLYHTSKYQFGWVQDISLASANFEPFDLVDLELLEWHLTELGVAVSFDCPD